MNIIITGWGPCWGGLNGHGHVHGMLTHHFHHGQVVHGTPVTGADNNVSVNGVTMAEVETGGRSEEEDSELFANRERELERERENGIGV